MIETTFIPQDQSQLDQFSPLLQRLTDSEAVAIAISMLFDTFEPEDINLDFSANPSTPAPRYARLATDSLRLIDR